jgi:hypothetical protein
MRRTSVLVPTVAIMLAACWCAPVSAQTAPDLRRPEGHTRPQARPDQATAEAGERKRIDVLANDEGVPPESAGPLQIEVKGPVTCGEARVDGRQIVYQGGDQCIGRQVTFGYSVRLQDETVSAVVTVTVKPRSVACESPNAAWKWIKIDGGRFERANAPAGVIDFAVLTDEDSFTVAPFCLMLEPVPADDLEKFVGTIPEAQRREQFPELFDDAGSSPLDSQGGSASRVSRRVAQAYVAKAGATIRGLELPSLNEYIAAAWELWTKHNDQPEAQAFIVSLRSGNLQWTSTPCGAADSFWTIGPSAGARERLTKLCFEQSRRDRTGFRLRTR